MTCSMSPAARPAGRVRRLGRCGHGGHATVRQVNRRIDVAVRAPPGSALGGRQSFRARVDGWQAELGDQVGTAAEDRDGGDTQAMVTRFG